MESRNGKRRTVVDLILDKKRVSINEMEWTIFDNNRPLTKFSVDKLLSYSIGKPWNIDGLKWDINIGTEGDSIITTCFDGRVKASLECKVVAGYLEILVSFANKTSTEMVDFSGSFTLPVLSEEACKVTIPHLIYNDNPSADPQRIVPHVGTKIDGGIIVEEHRLPIPAVNVEWKEKGSYPFLTLCSVPEVREGYDREYWSLGVIHKAEGECITALTGPLMFNGMKDVVYGGRCTPLSYFEGYKTLRPGEKISRRYRLDWGYSAGEGKGFRSIVSTGFHTFKPQAESREDYRSMIQYKLNVADSRYYSDGPICGYKTFGDANSFKNISARPEYFLYGWTGQTIKIAWGECLWGIKTGDKNRFKRGFDIVNFFLTEGMAPTKGLWYSYYMIDLKEWRSSWKNANDPIASRIVGESMLDVLDVMRLLKDNGYEVPNAWEEAVEATCAFLMKKENQTEDGIFPFAWHLDGTVSSQTVNASGMPCVMTFVKAYEYFKKDVYLDYAKEKYTIYAHLHMDTFAIPFARATMDAKCEDKEAGIYFFLAAANLYRVTREECYKEWAAISADWLLTFVFFWETGFRPGTTCRKKGFSTIGWPGVSVQNHHLDVFFPSYELYAFGKETGQLIYEVMGRNIRNAMTNGVCKKQGDWGFDVVGEQGEHYYHTNYYQSRYPGVLGHLEEWRGGMQVWNPSWITAQVLQNNLLFWSETENE